MDQFRIAVKAFIINDEGKLLIIKRHGNDVHKPGVWEIAGGRLELGEDPFDGIKREVLEEVGLEIEIKNPLKIHHFVRQDGQKITMIVFLCRAKSSDVRLSEEHTAYQWMEVSKAKGTLVKDYDEELEIYDKFFKSSVMGSS